MRKCASRASLRFALPAILILVVHGFGTTQTGPQRTPRESRTTIQALLRRAIPGTKDLQLVIELSDPPAAVALNRPAARSATALAGIMAGRGRLRLDTQTAIAYRAQIAGRRRLVTDQLQALSGVEVQGSTDVVMNSVIARVPVDQYSAVRRIPGIKKVYFSRLQRMNLNVAAQTQNAAALWARVSGGQTNAGQGQKIGILDTGIDNGNPMFADSTAPTPSSYPSGYPMYDTGNQDFVNHKVIVARSYVRFLSRDRDYTARDQVGHGTFVAGCAAGKLVTAPKAEISGMAPGAFLGNYKIFGTPGFNDFTSQAAVLAAIEDAVNDGMDVINLSLGSLDYIPPSEDVEVDAINNAIAAGVVVCLAAGNEGPDTHSINSPGSAGGAISVGGVFNARIFAPQLHVAGTGVPANLQTLAYQNGTGPAIPTAIPATPVTDAAALDGNGLACSPFSTGSLSGRIALVQRGTCTFQVKVTNAANAGARAVVVYNNVTGGDLLQMGGLATTAIPSVMIFNADGLTLKNYLSSSSGATISIGASTIDQLATPVIPVLVSDSSRGPSADFGIKPDLVAVGWNVYSAAQNVNSSGFLYDSSRFTVSQGTSFSTPMVSGAAAALLQLFPSLTPAGVKSALANTASEVTTDGFTPATVVQAGNGLLDMGAASAAGAIFSPSNLNFGVKAFTDTASDTRTLTITNISGNTDRFTLSVQPLISGPAISLSTNTTGSLASGGAATIDITMQATSAVTGGFQGFVVVRSSQTGATYSIPYWAAWYVADSQRILKVSQSATGPDTYSNLKDALAAANPGNIIEFADSQTYSLPLVSDSTLPAVTISTNAQGVPLHGITIRAAAGQTPVIDGSSAGAYADLQIVGLRGVLIQGLTINGGETGVDLLQPDPSIPLSVTIDHCKIINQADSSTSSGVYAESGGDIDITYSTISGSLSAGVVLIAGGQLTMSNSTVKSNGSDGIDAFDANVQLIHSTISNNIGQGVYLENCSGTLSGNTIANNTGTTYGDGVQIVDGKLTITGNTFESNGGAAMALLAGTINTPTGTMPGPGPTVLVNRNIFQANADYGLLIDQAKNASLTGNLIADNFQGIQVNNTSVVLLANNIIARSTNSSLGDGINIADTSAVRIVNCDFYQNRHQGIFLASGATVSVANSIISGNTLGDLVGVSASSVQFSLIGSSGLAGGNGNITGDPQFANPASNDFSLSAGSPAINAGSNAASDLPFLDYNQKFRVATSGAIPGSGQVDMGAVEFGATYPLVYPLMVNGFNATIADNYTTGLAVMNPTTNQQAAAFAAYRPDGNLITGSSNPALPLPLPPGAQVPKLGFEIFGLTQGAGEVGGVLASSVDRLTGFFLVFSQDFKRAADGVDVSSDTATRFYFPRHQFDSKGKATYVLFNPGVNVATVNAFLLDPSGTTVDQLTQPIILPPKGQSLFNFGRFTASSGSVSINSDRPIAGLELFGNASEIAGLRAAPPGTEARLFFPHFVVNGGYTSMLGVANTNGEPVNLKLTAYGNDGSILGSPAQRGVSANGQLFESAAGLFGLGSGTIYTGYVLVEGDKPGINGFCQFTYDNGVVQSTSAVPSQSVPQPKLIFSHVAHHVAAASGGNYETGIALLNPFGTAISYTLKVFDGSGALVASMTDSLGPHAKVAKVLSYPLPGPGFFTQPIVLANGHVEVTSDYQLLGFELFYTDGLTQMVAVMAQYPN